jgi:hypothetical protein
MRSVAEELATHDPSESTLELDGRCVFKAGDSFQVRRGDDARTKPGAARRFQSPGASTRPIRPTSALTRPPSLPRPQALASFTSLRKLSLAACGVRNAALETLPPLPALAALCLSDNAVSGGLNALARLPALRALDLSGNRLTVAALAPLTALARLTSLDLEGCPAGEERAAIFEMLAVLPAFAYLNGEDRAGNEKPADDEGSDGSEEEGSEEGSEGEEAAEGGGGGGGGGRRAGRGAGGAAGGAAAGNDDDDDDDNEAGGDAGGDDDEEDPEGEEEEEEVPTNVLAREAALSEDEEDYEEEASESDDDDSDDEFEPEEEEAAAAPRAKRARRAAASADEDEEEASEEEDDDEDSDYDA